MAEHFPDHRHCADCGRPFPPDELAPWDDQTLLCAKCFERRDVGAMSLEGKEHYFREIAAGKMSEDA